VFFFFPSTQTEEGADRGGLPAAGGGPPGNDGGREVGEQREEVEGDRFLSSPRVETVQGGRSTGGDGGELGRETEGWGPSWRGRAEGAARWIVSRAAVAEGGGPRWDRSVGERED
jgi:hypothetical protein